MISILLSFIYLVSGNSNGYFRRPYRLTLSSSSYTAGNSYTLTLESTGNAKFKEYVIAGFASSTTPTSFSQSNILGEIIPITNGMAVMTNYSGAITQTDGNIDKSSVLAKWIAPKTIGKGIVIFWAKVITNGINHDIYSHPITEKIN